MTLTDPINEQEAMDMAREAVYRFPEGLGGDWAYSCCGSVAGYDTKEEALLACLAHVILLLDHESRKVKA